MTLDAVFETTITDGRTDERTSLPLESLSRLKRSGKINMVQKTKVPQIFFEAQIFFPWQFQIFECFFLKKDDFSDLMVNGVYLTRVQSSICHQPMVGSNFLLLFVFKDSVVRLDL